MTSKVVFLDVDGTMVDADGRIPESTKNAIKQAQANGHRMVVCSGRSRFQISKELLELGFSGIVGGAGAFVVSDEEEIYHAYIDESHSKSIYDYLEGIGALFCYQTDVGIELNQRSSDGIFAMFREQGISEEFVANLTGELHVTETPWQNTHNEKLIYYKSPYRVQKMHTDLAPYFDVVAISLDGMDEYAGEIGISGINKATGIERYLKKVGIAREDSIAIGDGPNDLQMMEYAGIGVAMGNAREEVKQRADMVTDRIENDGLYKAFVKLGLI